MSNISIFTNEFDIQPNLTPKSWHDLCEMLKTSTPTIHKRSVKLWSPAQFVATRSSENVSTVNFAVFDLDNVTPEQVYALWVRLDSARIAYVAHTTYTHTENAPRWRLVLEMSRPVLGSKWKPIFSAIADRYGIPKDEKAKDPARMFWLPAHRPEETPLYRRSGALSIPVDVDALRLLSVVPPPAGPLDLGLYKKQLLTAFSDPTYVGLAEKIFHGKPLAQRGDRDNAVLLASGLLFEKWPELTESAAFALLLPSLQAMQAPDFEALEIGRLKIARDAERVASRLAKRAEESADLKEFGDGLVASLTASSPEPKNKPYTQEELTKWAAEMGLDSPEDLARQYIIQHENSFYVFDSGRYKAPIGYYSLMTALQWDFRRCSSLLWRESGKNGEAQRPAKPTEILSRNARSARSVVYSFALPSSRFDSKTETFHFAASPLRELKPVRHEDIHKWLCLMGGEHSEKLLDWVATITELGRMTCCIYFEGPKNSGKTLLPSGLARLWTEQGPVPMASVMGDFQDALTSCPLIFADEELPEVGRKKPTIFLRQILGSGAVKVNPKGRPPVTILGCPRVIMSANNPDLLKTFETLTVADLEATAERILHIQIPKACVDFLRTLPEDVKNDWIRKDKIAEHALWLKENRPVKSEGRFRVTGAASGALANLTISSDTSNAVCEWLVSYVMREKDPPELRRGSVVVGSGEILVSTQAFGNTRLWAEYCPSREGKIPHPRPLGKVLASLAVKGSGVVNARVSVCQFRLHRISTEHLTRWLNEAGSYTAEDFLQTVAKPNPDVEKIKQNNPQKFT